MADSGLLKELARERLARQLLSPTRAGRPAAADARPTIAFSAPLFRSLAGGHRLDGGAVEVVVRADPLLGIFLSGVEDQPPEARAKGVVEVDCRRDDAAFKAGTGGYGRRTFRFHAGLGDLKDRSGGDFERNVRHLEASARKIAAARACGSRVWVHCAQGINRGPAGLIAYLLLYTPTPSLPAAFKLVKAARAKARCKKNTFVRELAHICTLAGKPAKA